MTYTQGHWHHLRVCQKCKSLDLIPETAFYLVNLIKFIFSKSRIYLWCTHVVLFYIYSEMMIVGKLISSPHVLPFCVVVYNFQYFKKCLKFKVKIWLKCGYSGDEPCFNNKNNILLSWQCGIKEKSLFEVWCIFDW